MKIFIVLFLIPFFVPPCFSTTAKDRNIKIDGVMEEWNEDEIYYDSENDSPWGLYNELHKLLITWNEFSLYIGVVGVQKDGNNLIVYIDTSPFRGINDASKLKDPYNPQQLWWWRRGNVFPENFNPEFQWHMYEMRLSTNEGHGFFKLNNDYTVISLNNQVEQKSSGGGTAQVGSAEIKIPWVVLFGSPFFPENQEINILACMTGGMDQRDIKSIDKTADDWIVYYYTDPQKKSTSTVVVTKYERDNDLVEIDENNMKYYKYGSARDTIPDQSQPFPLRWDQKVKLYTFLTLKLDRVEGRQPYSRDLTTEFNGDKVVVKFNQFPWDKKYLTSSYYTIFCSTDFVNIKQGLSVSTQDTMVQFENLLADNTYYFSVCISSYTGLSETVSLYIPKFKIIDYKPKKFFFPSKNLKITFFCYGQTNEVLKFYWRYRGSDTEFIEVLLNKEDKNNYSVELQNIQESVEFYITAGENFIYPANTLATVEVLDKDVVELAAGVGKNIILYDGANYSLALSVPKESVSTNVKIIIENCSLGKLFDYPVLNEKVKLEDVETMFRICTEDGKDLKFVKPIEVTLPAGQSTTAVFFDGKNGVYVLPVVKNGGNISCKLYSTGFVILTKERLQQTIKSKLCKVVNPSFSYGKQFLHLVFSDNTKKEVGIFDLNYNLIWESGVKQEYEIVWDGKTNSLLPVPKGLYIYQIKFENGEVITGLCAVR